MRGERCTRAFGRRHARRRHRAETARRGSPSASFRLAGIEGHHRGRIPLSRASRPACRVPLSSALDHPPSEALAVDQLLFHLVRLDAPDCRLAEATTILTQGARKPSMGPSARTTGNALSSRLLLVERDSPPRMHILPLLYEDHNWALPCGLPFDIRYLGFCPLHLLH